MSYEVGDIVTVQSLDHFFKMSIYKLHVDRFITPNRLIVYYEMLEYCNKEFMIASKSDGILYNRNPVYFFKGISYLWDEYCFNEAYTKKKEIFHFIDFNLDL